MKEIRQYFIDLIIAVVLVCFFYFVSGKTILGLIFGLVWVVVDHIGELKRKNEALEFNMNRLNDYIFDRENLAQDKTASKQFDNLISAMQSGGIKLGFSAQQILECFKAHEVDIYYLFHLKEIAAGESFVHPNGIKFDPYGEHKMWFTGYAHGRPAPCIEMIFKSQKLVSIKTNKVMDLGYMAFHKQVIKQCKKTITEDNELNSQST